MFMMLWVEFQCYVGEQSSDSRLKKRNHRTQDFSAIEVSLSSLLGIIHYIQFEYDQDVMQAQRYMCDYGPPLAM